MEGTIPMEHAKELRAELLEKGRALDLAVIRCGSPDDSDPGFARSFSAIESFVGFWTAYCRTTRREFFSSEHEAWCQEVIDCVPNKIELRAHSLLRDASTTETYVRGMVQALEDEGQSEDIN